MGAFEWELPEDLQSDMFVGNTATWWLDAKPKPDGPLFMEIGFPGPHPPFDPTERFIEKYRGKKLPLPKIKREDIAGQPEPFQKLREHNFEVDHDSVVHLDDPSEEQLQRLGNTIWPICRWSTRKGGMLEALDRNGYLDNTVLFTSDHGEALESMGTSKSGPSTACKCL